jgi:hypothetical protein
VPVNNIVARKTVRVRLRGDGAPVIGGGGGDRTVRVWRLADGAPVGEPLDLPELVQAVAIHGNFIITAAGADITIHQPVLPQPIR